MTLTAIHRPVTLSRVALVMLLSLPLVLRLPPLPSLSTGISQRAALDTLPLAFVPNVGQFNPGVRMQTRGMGGTLSFVTDGIVLDLPSITSKAVAPTGVHLQFVGATTSTRIIGSMRLPGDVSYYRGNDPAHWRTNVPAYRSLSYQQLYPGVDLHYDGTNGHLKGTYLLAAGADPNAIRWHYAGTAAPQTDSTGNLIIGLPDGRPALVEHAPVAWQMVSGRRVRVAAHYALECRSNGAFRPWYLQSRAATHA